ncbi:dual oxidase 2-like [Paramuricea clavata]|uniref:Dual oxidase 2-like n=1 Tax=Paramuricea clavata TaxID=317549 RepID=A0A7D9EKQ1_PARCT|nr:dual oxidase 2-like [Paramuricea clavata]
MLSSVKWIKLLVYFAVLLQVPPCDSEAIEYERYDGWFNNLANPSWGTVGSPLSRVSPPVYEDGVYQPSGSTRPNPLLLSSTLMSSDDVTRSRKSFRNSSVMMVFFAQHVAHDIVDTSRPGCPPEYMNIHVPKGKHDKYDYKYIPFTRSNYHSDSGKSPNTPRQQINEATPWLDGGAIYGTSKSWTDSLRSLKDGKLSASKMGDWPDENSMGLPMSNPAIPSTHEVRDAKRLLKLGNHRGNENPFLLSVGILWFRYHNKMAEEIQKEHPDWNDDTIFNEARKWVIATYQHIVFYEWLPAFLSPRYTKESLQKDHPYKRYKNSVHPGVSHMFQSAAMRFAETMVPSYIVKK